MVSVKKVRGIIAVEMAFALPVLLLFILFTIEVARFFWAEHWLSYNLHNAAMSESLAPGVGVQQRLTEGLVRAGVLVSAADVKVEKQNLDWSVGSAAVERYVATAELDFYLLPTQTIPIRAVTWLSNEEDQIQ